MDEDIEAQWIINQINNPRFVVSHLPQDLVQYYRTSTNAISLQTDVLAKLLSYIDKKDVYRVIQVCKKWYKATRKKHFWSKLIEQEKQAYISRESMFGGNTKLDRNMLLQVDVFMSPNPNETLMEKLDWIFARDQHKLAMLSSTVICKRNRYNFSFTRYRFKNKKLYSVFYYCSDWKISYKQYIDTSKYTKYIHIPDIGVDNAIIKWIDPNVGTFEGQAIVLDQLWKPQGKGKWIFNDGTTLEGEHVAECGYPVQPLDRSQKKRRKMK